MRINTWVAATIIGFGAPGIDAAAGLTPDLAPVTYRTVILEGEQAPGLPEGVTIAHVETPAINEYGKSAFGVRLAGPGVTEANELAIYAEAGNELRLVHRYGEPLPGISGGATFFPSLLSRPRFTSADRVFAPVQFQGADDDFALMAFDMSGGAEVLLRSGRAVDGLASDDLVIEIGHFEARGATCAVAARLQDPVTELQRDVLLRFDGDDVVELLNEQTTFPEHPGAILTGITPLGIDIDGRIGVHAYLTGPLIFDQTQALVIADHKMAEAALSLGDYLPDVNASVAKWAYGPDFRPEFSLSYRNGWFAGTVELDGPLFASPPHHRALFAASADTFRLLTQGGAPVEGATEGDQFWPMALGQPPSIGYSSVAVLAPVFGSSSSAIIRADVQVQTIHVPLHDLQPPPGSTVGSDFLLVRAPTVNQRDRMTIEARVLPESCGCSGDILYVVDESGELHLQIDLGDAVNVAPGDTRIIAALSHSSAPLVQIGMRGETGWALSLNNRGQTARVLEFDDGARGVFVATVAGDAAPHDLNVNGFVDGADLAQLLGQWGQCESAGGPCGADFDADGAIDGQDLAALLANWGAN